MNIKRKKTELDTRCPMCHRFDEDGGHLFIKCERVKAVWRTRGCSGVPLVSSSLDDGIDFEFAKGETVNNMCVVVGLGLVDYSKQTQCR